MEENQPPSLFEMQMDATAQSHLLSISKWSRFISIFGFIVGLLILVALALGGQLILDAIVSFASLGQRDIAGILIGIVVVAFAFTAAWLYFLFRASSLLRRGLQSGNTHDLAEGFKAMKTFFIFSSIISLFSILSTLLGMFNN
jgi:hypothetical protein